MSAKRSQKPIDPKDLGRWRLIADFQQRLQSLSGRMEVAATFADPKRQLQLEEYLGLFLFGLLNPVVRTMRALCRSSHQQRVREDICGRPVSLGSFSEMQAVVDPALLKAAFCELVEEVNPRFQGKRPAKECPHLHKSSPVCGLTLWLNGLKSPSQALARPKQFARRTLLAPRVRSPILMYPCKSKML